MRRLIKHIPNTLTSLNLLCGSLSILLALNGELLQSGYLLLIAFHFDIFDGLSARLLKVKSEIGQELDSLADVVSFGLGPAAILFAMLKPALGVDSIHFGSLEIRDYLIFVPLLLPVFAALRLAKFNINVGKSDNFAGMPTPANALMVLSIPLIANNHPDSFLVHWFHLPEFILIYSILASFMMVCPLPIYGFKLKGFSWAANKWTFILLAGVALILVFFGYSGLFLNVVFYIVFGSILAQFLKRKSLS